jgi:multidrug efflux system membrane fusion protein
MTKKINVNVSPLGKLIAQAVLGLGLLAVAAALYFHTQKPVDSGAVASPARSVSVVDGVTVVTLKVAAQRQSGLGTEPLAAASHRPEATAYGTVLDLQPLFDLRSHYATAQSGAAAARASASASRAEQERSRLLYEDDRNISLRALQTATAGYQSDAAKADAAAVGVRDIEAAVRQQFGPAVAGWALGSESAEFVRILRRSDVLVRVTLAPGAPVKAADQIQVQAATGGRLPAYLVSAGVPNDPGIAGAGFIYRVAAALPAGSAVTAFLPAAAQAEQGVLVPASAVVWYAGQPWAYLQTGEATFARRPLGQPVEQDAGLFVARGLKAGERVVTQGAQLLLSEEQKPPPTGAGCKDPECD